MNDTATPTAACDNASADQMDHCRFPGPAEGDPRCLDCGAPCEHPDGDVVSPDDDEGVDLCGRCHAAL